jgi:hypothetical protein
VLGQARASHGLAYDGEARSVFLSARARTSMRLAQASIWQATRQMLVRSGFWNKQKRCWVWLNYQECWLECIVAALVNLSWCKEYVEVYRSSGGRIKGPRLRPHHMKRASGSWCLQVLGQAHRLCLGKQVLAWTLSAFGKQLDPFAFTYRLAFSPCSSEYLSPILLHKFLYDTSNGETIYIGLVIGTCTFSLLK